jgi:hypothetical protein
MSDVDYELCYAAHGGWEGELKGMLKAGRSADATDSYGEECRRYGLLLLLLLLLVVCVCVCVLWFTFEGLGGVHTPRAVIMPVQHHTHTTPTPPLYHPSTPSLYI